MMQVKSISVRNFRKFVDPVLVTGLTPGINVIAGSNEDGKSTLVQAIKAAFYTRHSTSATQLFQPYGSSALPEVGLEFSLDNIDYTLKKTFGKKGTAELRGGSAIFSNSEAEEQLQKLLSLGGEKTKENTSIWNVLWVEQGTAFLSPQLGEIGKRTLNAALENEIGKIINGDENHQLLRRVSELYLQWFTRKSGQAAAGSELKAAEKQLTEATETYDKLRQEFETYKATLEEMQAVRDKLAHHEKNNSLVAAKKAAEEAQKANEELGKQSAELDKLKVIESRELSEYEKVSAVWQSRDQLRKAVADNQAHLQTLTSTLDTLRKQFDDDAKELHTCQENERTVEQQLANAEQACAQAESALEQAQLSTRVLELQKNLAAAQTAQKEAQELKLQALAIKVDSQTLQKAKTLRMETVEAKAQLQAVATKIQFKPAEGKKVTSNEKEVNTTKSLILSKPTTFELEGWGEIVVTPGGEGIEELRVRWVEAQKQLNALLVGMGVEDIEQAEEQENTRKEFASKAEQRLREVLHFAPAGVEKLTQELSEITSKLSANSPNEAIDTSAVKQALATSKAERDKFKQLLAQQRATTQRASAQFNDTNAKLQAATAEETTRRSALDTQSEKLAQLRGQESDEQLEQRLMEARHKKEAATQAREQMQTLLQEQNAGTAATAAENARRDVERVQQEIQMLRERQSELAGSLQTFGKASIAEEFQKSQDKKEQAEALFQRVSKKASAVKLLFDTLTAAEQDSKSELMAPLIRNLEPYVSRVFDNGKLGFEQASFTITSLHRGAQAEEYSALSLGTREQLSILVRLAFAHVLAENGCPAVLILDDALVYSDEERFAKMQSALLQASESFQVLILTCRERDWKNLDAPTFYVDRQRQSAAALRLFGPTANSSSEAASVSMS